MGKLRKKVGAFLERWGLVSQSYTAINEIKNLVKFGFFHPPTYLEIPDKKVTYCIMPKVACSSIKASLYLQNFKDDYSVHREIPGEPKLLKDDPEYFKFSFVRNPFDRLVSCYESKYHRDVEIKMDVLDFRFYLLGSLAKDRGFNRFIKSVCIIPKRFANMHFRSQYLTIYRHGKCMMDFVGKFENLEIDYEPIRAKYGFDPLRHYNKSNRSNWMDYYTPKTAKMVYRKFKKDFEIFGYQDEYEKLLKYLAEKEQNIS
ncbi:MAG TPA: sulfotransferase family 2 domain-containing protein [Oscillospiraceae bacterium]|nr:sulfotransferase family 2 domain-containing protein [Oscillospiraceae bacterium]HPK35645.1 sulfotransferase family 2 domain-containing protein [Oscillospiraceae bacterium]HPR74708.1 sulfotransferase family 2 domain-containing protein [Oscillospiraceae bacterium]